MDSRDQFGNRAIVHAIVQDEPAVRVKVVRQVWRSTLTRPAVPRIWHRRGRRPVRAWPGTWQLGGGRLGGQWCGAADAAHRGAWPAFDGRFAPRPAFAFGAGGTGKPSGHGRRPHRTQRGAAVGLVTS
jgi:hypothetical protein